MILDELAQATKARIQRHKEEMPLSEVRAIAESMENDGSFPFRAALEKEGMSFICEVKKASPSKGLIAPDFPYLDIAREYEEAGAAAISCLTETDFFLGSDEYLRQIAQKVSIPVLRKDFTVDEYMIFEAKTLGASAILLICTLLERETLRYYLEIAHSIGLSALVETHDEAEMESALYSGADIIGVNNRNLKDFTVDIDTAVRLRALAPSDKIFVAESGIKNAEDVARLYENNCSAVLIGETLMRSDNKRAALEELRCKLPGKA
ncbi:MAG: indole-3-glycerol phosphate synthase TrpC [Lachnospiraceae bacterium]|nr:indole-3-glycerol phosphate synthase TrpC [Lachnospiraceae bacterium]